MRSRPSPPLSAIAVIAAATFAAAGTCDSSAPPAPSPLRCLPEARPPTPSPELRAARVALLEAIARDIEGLTPRFPQLAGFRAASSLDREKLEIQYARNVHPPTHFGGWTAGVPNPDADGVWLHVDLHDPCSMLQLHTQPDVPLFDVLGQKLMLLVLDGERTQPLRLVVLAILKERSAAAGGGLVLH